MAFQKRAVQHLHSLRYSTGSFVDLLEDLNGERRDLFLIYNAVVDRATLTLNRDDRPMWGHS